MGRVTAIDMPQTVIGASAMYHEQRAFDLAGHCDDLYFRQCCGEPNNHVWQYYQRRHERHREAYRVLIIAAAGDKVRQ